MATHRALEFADTKAYFVNRMKNIDQLVHRAGAVIFDLTTYLFHDQPFKGFSQKHNWASWANGMSQSGK